MPESAPTVDVAIPAFNEEESLPLVLAAIPRPPVRRVVVATTTPPIARPRWRAEGGAVVVAERRPGYGSACLAPSTTCAPRPSRHRGLPRRRLLRPPRRAAAAHRADLSRRCRLVIGSRTLGQAEAGALLPQARAGNLRACPDPLLYGHRYTDLGPFRAIRWEALERLAMSDPDFGWTAEMQVKALRHGLRVAEVPVSYRRRIGVSKITGTLRGTVLAGYKILWTVLRYSWAPQMSTRTAPDPVRCKVDIDVRYAETDQMGVVHHANYLVWFEHARTQLCLESGLHYADIERAGFFMMVTERRSSIVGGPATAIASP